MPDFNGDSHEENRRKINRLRASSWRARSFSWLNSHPDEHHLKVLPLASSLCLWFPYPSLKRHTRISPPALFLSDCHMRVTTGYLPTRIAESIPHSSFPQSAAPFSSKLLAHAHLHIPQRASPKPSELSALSCLHNNWFFAQGHWHSSPLSHCVSHPPKHSLCSAVLEGCSCTKGAPLNGSMKTAGPPEPPFVPTDLYWCLTSDLGIITKHTPAEQLW